MNKFVLFLSLLTVNAACSHAPVAPRTPDSVNAAEASPPRCALLRGNHPVTAQQGDHFQPVYRVLAPNHYVTFLTLDQAGCTARGFIGDGTPEGYVPNVADLPEDVDPLKHCRVAHGPARYVAVEPKTKFKVPTNDAAGCAEEGFVIKETSK